MPKKGLKASPKRSGVRVTMAAAKPSRNGHKQPAHASSRLHRDAALVARLPKKTARASVKNSKKLPAPPAKTEAPAKAAPKSIKMPSLATPMMSAKKRKALAAKEIASLRPLVPLPPPPVTTDAKPKKNLAGLTARELDDFRSMLLRKRRELLGDVTSMEREALQSGQGSNLSNLPVHMADMGTDNYEQEFTLGLVEKDRGLLREINHALAKIQDGSYGICDGTGKPIPRARLEIQPWAKYSVEYARQLEKNMMLRR